MREKKIPTHLVSVLRVEVTVFPLGTQTTAINYRRQHKEPKFRTRPKPHDLCFWTNFSIRWLQSWDQLTWEQRRARNCFDSYVFNSCWVEQWNILKLLTMYRVINATQKAKPTVTEEIVNKRCLKVPQTFGKICQMGLSIWQMPNVTYSWLLKRELQ